MRSEIKKLTTYLRNILRNVCIVVATKPSYARVKTLLIAIKKHPKLKLSLIVTGWY